MQHTPNVVDAPITNTVEPLADRTEKAAGRVAQLRMERNTTAPTPTIGVVDADGTDRATAQRCDAPRSIEVPDPRTGIESPRHPDTSYISGLCTTPHEVENRLSGKRPTPAPARARTRPDQATLIEMLAVAEYKSDVVKIATDQAKAATVREDGDGEFDSHQKWNPHAGQYRALALVQYLLVSPHFARFKGNGAGLVDALLRSCSSEFLNACNRLGCDPDDVMLAGDKVRVLAGETFLGAAVARMKLVQLPPAIECRVRHPNMNGLVRLLAAMTEIRGHATVYLSCADAARALGIDRGSAGRTLRLLDRLHLIECVDVGSRKHPNAKGMASEYRVPWFTPTNGG
jgi:hypothetical protein